MSWMLFAVLWWGSKTPVIEQQVIKSVSNTSCLQKMSWAFRMHSFRWGYPTMLAHLRLQRHLLLSVIFHSLQFWGQFSQPKASSRDNAEGPWTWGQWIPASDLEGYWGKGRKRREKQESHIFHIRSAVQNITPVQAGNEHQGEVTNRQEESPG